MLIDITERKKHEQKQWQYTEQISRYADEIKEIYDYAPCGYHSLDKNGRFYISTKPSSSGWAIVRMKLSTNVVFRIC